MLIDELIKEIFIQIRFKTTLNNGDFLAMKFLTTNVNVVYYIPGWSEDYSYFDRMNKVLNANGISTTIAYKKDTKLSILKMAEINRDYILQNNLANITIISHSRGGLIAKYMLDNYPDINERVHRLITIAVPWGGVIWGNLPIWNLKEMGNNSSLRKSIVSNLTNVKKVTNMYPSLDTLVIPNSSLLLDGAENTEYKVIGHGRILEDDEVINKILNSNI